MPHWKQVKSEFNLYPLQLLINASQPQKSLSLLINLIMCEPGQCKHKLVLLHTYFSCAYAYTCIICVKLGKFPGKIYFIISKLETYLLHWTSHCQNVTCKTLLLLESSSLSPPVPQAISTTWQKSYTVINPLLPLDWRNPLAYSDWLLLSDRCIVIGCLLIYLVYYTVIMWVPAFGTQV